MNKVEMTEAIVLAKKDKGWFLNKKIRFISFPESIPQILKISLKGLNEVMAMPIG